MWVQIYNEGIVQGCKSFLDFNNWAAMLIKLVAPGYINANIKLQKFAISLCLSLCSFFRKCLILDEREEQA